MMKKIYMSALFYFLIGFINCQTIEVTVTDTIMCEVENYSYLLNANFGGNNQVKKISIFEEMLASNKGNYTFLYGEQIGDDRDFYRTVNYEINFKGLKDKEDFETRMKSKEQLYALTLLQKKLEYGEKEQIRLIEKLLQKGKEKAKIIAQGLGRNLGVLKNIEDTNNSNLNTPEDIVIFKRLGKNENLSKENEAIKMKTIKITFDTEK